MEELATNPVKMGEEVYKLLNQSLPLEVRAWLATNTQNSDSDWRSTRRDSAKVIDKWKTMPLENICIIEMECMEFLIKNDYELLC